MINNTFVIHEHILFHQHTWQRLSEKRSRTIHFFDRIIFIQKVCELIVYLWNDTGNDHTGGSGIIFITHDSFLH